MFPHSTDLAETLLVGSLDLVDDISEGFSCSGELLRFWHKVKVELDSIDFGPKREKFHFSEANISRTKRSRGMISTVLESGFQPLSKTVEDNLLELPVLEII